MGIFSKTSSKEYNERLENILENKKIDSEAKNLLLSMLYKIENAYNDYSLVKRNIPPREELIEKILYIIEKRCNEIVVVTPGTKKSSELEKINQKYIVDAQNGRIIVYANEKDLLYAIYMLNIQLDLHIVDKAYDIDKGSKEEILQYKSIQNFYSIGTAMHEAEIIRDFSGWSWSVSQVDIEDININLIYQNLLQLVGEKAIRETIVPQTVRDDFMHMHANVKDLRKYNKIIEESKSNKKINSYNDAIKKLFSEKYGLQKSKGIIYDINLAILAIELKRDTKKKKAMTEKLKELKRISNLMKDKEKFIDSLKKNQRKLEGQIKKINDLLESKLLLEIEYDKRNAKLPNEKKIFSPNHLAKMLDKERKNLNNELKTEASLLNEKKYIEQQKKYEKEIAFHEKVIAASEKIELLIIRIQLEYMKCFMGLIDDAKNKEELIELIYKFRYYCMLPVNKKKKVKDVEELKQPVKEIINLLLDKCIDKKVIENISNSVSLCYNILKYIFDTQTICLENFSVKVTKDKEESNGENSIYYITIDLFDEKEQVEKHTDVVDNLTLLNIKLRKKTPIFLNKA